MSRHGLIGCRAIVACASAARYVNWVRIDSTECGDLDGLYEFGRDYIGTASMQTAEGKAAGEQG